MAEEIADPADVTITATPTAAQLAADATRGWAELQRATNVVLPQLLNEAERISRATLRLLNG